jgi:hypothetical protein
MASARAANAIALALVALGAAISPGCSSPDPSARVVLEGPDIAGFEKASDDAMLIKSLGVGDAAGRSCGSLDCHGQIGRNFRVYSYFGMRLNPKDVVADKVFGATTKDEYDETYHSLVGLEPEIMAAVVEEGGTQPTRLTFIRKMRGIEKHKGGTLAAAGDLLDRCFTSWLSNRVDRDACSDASVSPVEAPRGPDEPAPGM